MAGKNYGKTSSMPGPSGKSRVNKKPSGGGRKGPGDVKKNVGSGKKYGTGHG